MCQKGLKNNKSIIKKIGSCKTSILSNSADKGMSPMGSHWEKLCFWCAWGHPGEMGLGCLGGRSPWQCVIYH